MPSDPDPLPRPQIIMSTTARTIGAMLYWTGVVTMLVSGLAIVSLHVWWMDMAISGVPAEDVSRGIWFAFGPGMVSLGAGAVIGLLTDVRDAQVGGPL